MRVSPAFLVLLLSALSLPSRAASINDNALDQQRIDALEQRASQAQPKEQYFLYAELVHDMVEYSARQYASGDVDKATSLLKRVQLFTHKIEKVLAGNDKKLKDAQILLRHTAFRLNEMLHAGGYEDRPLVEQTLAQLNQAQTAAMMQVFRK